MRKSGSAPRFHAGHSHGSESRRRRKREKVLMDFSWPWKCLLFRSKTILDPCLLADESIFEIYGLFCAVSSWL